MITAKKFNQVFFPNAEPYTFYRLLLNPANPHKIRASGGSVTQTRPRKYVPWWPANHTKLQHHSLSASAILEHP